MKRHGYGGGSKVGFILAVVGAVMIVALILPLRFWWLAIGLCFLFGGLHLLKK